MVTRLRAIGPAEAIGAVLVVLLLVAMVAPGVLAPYDPYEITPSDAFQGPSWTHWFGTDESGRDAFSRVIHGTRSSLLIGLLAMAVGLGLAVLLGTLAGLGNRALDFAVGRVLEVLFAVPGLLLALLFVAVLGGGVVPSGIAVGLATAPGYARLIRTQVISARTSGYAEAATVLGRSRWTSLRRHILPNMASRLFVLATLGVGQAVVWACSLSFLGLGVTPPNTEWGAMLAAGRGYIANAWWLTVFPGVFIVVTAATLTLLGRSFQNRARET
ncbi:ABC transporter permease [Actinocorallia sp. A-T 12471]|uniref:ABC transporter permease n=1 Tax=Actinocorallia sp. A-T 12471 TaxID=3089813 RepID=UPI0029CC5FEE|nr:ABC transporter permease [Actinocorallia sp. A-T 12471]MDX6742317.1 ABC transporter permease [Actinocorallia sp. A-T 12471]